MPARAAASRRNGSLSHGPVSPEGKARAARNALKHGLTAATPALLASEDPAAFEAAHLQLIKRLRPQGELELDLARKATWSAWLVRRADRLMADFLNRIEAMPDGRRPAGAALADELRLATAFRSLERHRARLQREHERLVETLLDLIEIRTEAVLQNEPGEVQNEPEPPPAAPAPPPLNRQQRRALARLARQDQPKRLAVPPGHG